jgi:hypothetical protein
MKIQYINQIEKALFGEFNNGQLADFPKVRLKKATWLSYVCFKPEIGQEQMQQAALLSGEHNPKDQVAAHVLEIVNVNDITNVQLTLESLSKLHAEKLRSGRIRNEFLNFDLGDTDSIFNEQ